MAQKFEVGDRVSFVDPLGHPRCGEIVREWPDFDSYSVLSDGGFNYYKQRSGLTLAEPKEEIEVMQREFKSGERVYFTTLGGGEEAGTITWRYHAENHYEIFGDDDKLYYKHGESLKAIADLPVEPGLMPQAFVLNDRVTVNGIAGPVEGTIKEWRLRHGKLYAIVTDDEGRKFVRWERELALTNFPRDKKMDQPFAVKIEEKEVVQTIKVKTVHLKLTEDEFKVIMRALNAFPQSEVSDLWDRLDDFANDNGIIDDESEF